MKWHVAFTKQARDFIRKQNLSPEVFNLIKLSIKKLQGESVSVDIKKMKGAWGDFYRIRKGKWRVIASFDFNKQSVFIVAVDWRGNIY